MSLFFESSFVAGKVIMGVVKVLLLATRLSLALALLVLVVNFAYVLLSTYGRRLVVYVIDKL